MPKYMLDTNMCIYLMKNQPESVARRFADCIVGDVVMSAITFAELEYGVAVSRDPERERANLDALPEMILIAPFNTEAARSYRPIRKARRERRQDHPDKLIAALSVALCVTLVTNDLRHFQGYPGLRIENWLDR